MPVPGEIILSRGDTPVTINAGRRTLRLTVRNTGDRAVQIGSHFHFFEVNRALEFDRGRAIGMRLNIPAGTAVRFEPGQARDVELVAIGGTKRPVGFNGLLMGGINAKWTVQRALERAARLGFKSSLSSPPSGAGPDDATAVGAAADAGAKGTG